jgi:hypothetical protein
MSEKYTDFIAEKLTAVLHRHVFQSGAYNATNDIKNHIYTSLNTFKSLNQHDNSPCTFQSLNRHFSREKRVQGEKAKDE